MTDTISQVGAGAPADRLREALAGLLAIVHDSRGVAGYHLNGAIAEWDEFPEVEAARATLDDLPECGCCGKTGECDADCDARQAAPAAAVVQAVSTACSACRGSGKELNVYGPATPCRDCHAAPAVHDRYAGCERECGGVGGICRCRVDEAAERERVQREAVVTTAPVVQAEQQPVAYCDERTLQTLIHGGAFSVGVEPAYRRTDGNDIAPYAAPPAHPDAALGEALEELVSAVRSINRSRHHQIQLPADSEPVYWQRKEWIDWILGLADSADAALAGKGGDQ